MSVSYRTNDKDLTPWADLYRKQIWERQEPWRVGEGWAISHLLSVLLKWARYLLEIHRSAMNRAVREMNASCSL